jgi:hypothetical protein
VIAEITSYADYETFSQRLRDLGFREDISNNAPLCRWLIDDVQPDVMPIEERILGFTNRWYRSAMNAAQEIELERGLRIRMVTAAYFIATKLEAFRSRGRRDYTMSRDLEDLLAVIDGREAIVEEIAAVVEIRSYIAEQFRSMLANQAFIDNLPAYLPPDVGSQGRLIILVNRMTEISNSL